MNKDQEKIRHPVGSEHVEFSSQRAVEITSLKIFREVDRFPNGEGIK